ncbi:MAG: [protein-PII] uridylyltransferase [Myxococcota bacterium]|nr:[protein-PII] uridylyltransferase [Myxococcota bacterium]MDW8360794.1 [protein-PII] uridylyltransferase [Myxococcales bacterium]
MSRGDRVLDLGRVEPGLVGVCADYLRGLRAGLVEDVLRGADGRAVCTKHARGLDGLLSALWCAATASARARAIAPRGAMTLVAVGGYGRRLVPVHGDVDLLVLADDPAEPAAHAIAEAVLYPLWDLGVPVGHAVRSVDETIALARHETRTATTLLDARRVAGDPSPFERLEREGRESLMLASPDVFLEALRVETAARHERYGDSIYLLEPEVKLGRGGLRDIDVIGWVLGARWGARVLEHAVQSGALLAREAHQLDAAHRMLLGVRNELHVRAGRRQDRLTFADQEEIARRRGFADETVLGVERFMQQYYRHARTVTQLLERVFDRARQPVRRLPPSRRDLGDGTWWFDGQLALESRARLLEQPVVALRLYRRCLELDAAPYPHARDLVAEAASDPDWCARLRADPEAAAHWLALLTHAPPAPVRRGSILAELHEVGLLLAMLPEFEPVTGRVQHDVYHVYTVDVHSVATVDRLRALVRGEMRAQLPLATRLAVEAGRRPALFLGLLLHDVGKAHGKDHSRRGAEMAGPIARRLGLDPGEADHVAWLVAEHLSLYHWATRRDLADPETRADLARRVGSLERLRDLYLLTVCDLGTTNPGALNAWKSSLLDDAYLALHDEIEAGGGEPATDRVRARRAQIETRLLEEPAARDFVRTMPDRYVLAHDPDAILRHARTVAARARGAVELALAPGPSVDVAELLLCADDRPGLLADVAAVLAAHRLSVVSAEVHTRPRPEGGAEAVDVFLVRREHAESPPLDAHRFERLRRDLGEVLEGRKDALALLSSLPRPPSWSRRRIPSVPTEVHVDNAASRHHTVVEVFTRDRIGLLHVIARTLAAQGVSIALSRIATEGARATDVFYVTNRDGAKIDDPQRLSRLAVVLREALERFHAESEARPASAEQA